MSREGSAVLAPLSHRSVSQLTTFTRCGESYRLEKVARAPTTPAAWFAQGTAFHEAIEKWEATGREYGPSDIEAWYHEAWNREVDKMFQSQPDIDRWETGGRTKPSDDLSRRYLRGKEQALAYREYALSTSEEWRILEYLPGEPAVEVPFEIELGGVTVKGYIDQVLEFRDGEIRPRDLKTGNKLPESPFQLGVYRLAIAEVMGILPRYGDFFMAKNNAPTKPDDLSIWTPELVGEMFRDMDKAVRAEIFIPNKGDGCRICLVREFCKIGGTRASEYLGITRRDGESRPLTTDFQYG